MEVLSKVPHLFQRSYLPARIDFSSWSSVEPWFVQLEGRPLDTVEKIELWLKDRSELLDVINEEGALRYIRMTCDTEDKDLEKAYFDFLEKISENVKVADDRLKRLFLASPSVLKLPSHRYAIMVRSLQNDVDLFREANIPLETEESKLSQSYQKLMGSLTVQF